MGPRLPTFFQDLKNTYALFPGAPARGISPEPGGAWTMSFESIPLHMRWAVFHHVCTVLCAYSEPKAWVGFYDKDKMAFGGSMDMKSHTKMVLTSLQLGQIRWAWVWESRALIIPEDAKWFSPSAMMPV